MTLSASVNFSTSGYTRNDLNSYYSNSFTENTKSSTINMTYRIPNSKWSFSTTANISQRTQDSTLAVSFPNLTVSLSQVYPFKRKRAVGAERWYEKNQALLLRSVPELADSQAGPVLQEEPHKGLA